MKIFRTLAASLALCTGLSAFADQYFRNHRYDSFQATPMDEGAIVFAGNSITNMHSWFEAFGSHQDVVGRGNSGGFAYEILENLESYIDSKPSKLFLMIGTNDISAATSDAKGAALDIQTIVRRVRLESPETEVYVQTILPRTNNAQATFENCNDILRQWVPELNDPKVHLIDLSEPMAPLGQSAYNSTWSCWDGLHPRAIGYQAWCRYIQEQVGYNTIYDGSITAAMQTNPAGINNSAGGRAEQFMFYPVQEGDVLFYGDDLVHQGEWHELLRSNKIKDRGGYWGWGGYNLTAAKAIVKTSLENQANKPAKIFFFYGVGGKDTTNYRAIVDEAKAQAPEAKIYIVSLTPSTNATTNTANVEFNTELEAIAEEKGATYVDIYTPMNADLSKNIMHTNYPTGRGYAVMSLELAKYLEEEGVNPQSLEEFDVLYNYRAARRTVGNALTTAMKVSYGDQVGQIKPQYQADIEAAITQAVAAVTDPTLDQNKANAAAEALNAVVNTARADLNFPTASTAANPTWYTIASKRGNTPITSFLPTGESVYKVGRGAMGKVSSGYNVWRFEDRGDNTYNIVNAAGQYINPVCNYNAAFTLTDEVPQSGFSLSYSNHSGCYVIYSGNVQLNQAASGYNLNWHSGNNRGTCPNRDDDGCAYNLVPFSGRIVAPDQLPTQTGWYEIWRDDNGMAVTNMDEMTLQIQSATKHYCYAMQYVSNPEPSPKNWIHLTIDGDNKNLRTLNGFEVGEYIAAQRTPFNIAINASASVALAYEVQYFLPFTNNGIPNVIGRSYNKKDPHYFARVTDSQLSNYDIWTVNAIGDEKAADLIDDMKVTLSHPGNKGLATVYHNGTFFVEKDAEVRHEHVAVSHPTLSRSAQNPLISVDNAAKTITVDYTQEPSGISEISSRAEKNRIFDLWGRRVATPRHGLYIVNGRKVRL